MLRFADGFDWSTGQDNVTDMWTAWTKAATNSIIAAQGRFGTSAYRAQNWSNPFELSITIDQQQTWIVGFAFKLDGTTAVDYRLLAFHDQGTEQCYLQLNATTLTLSAYRGNGTVLGTSTVALTQGAYAYIEVKVKVHASTGTFEVRKDETVILTVTGANTQMSGANQANNIRFAAEEDRLIVLATSTTFISAISTDWSIKII